MCTCVHVAKACTGGMVAKAVDTMDYRAEGGLAVSIPTVWVGHPPA